MIAVRQQYGLHILSVFAQLEAQRLPRKERAANCEPTLRQRNPELDREAEK
jgi:hypothetical protein